MCQCVCTGERVRVCVRVEVCVYVCTYVRQVLQVLETTSYVHGDLRPQNLVDITPPTVNCARNCCRSPTGAGAPTADGELSAQAAKREGVGVHGTVTATSEEVTSVDDSFCDNALESVEPAGTEGRPPDSSEDVKPHTVIFKCIGATRDDSSLQS